MQGCLSVSNTIMCSDRNGTFLPVFKLELGGVFSTTEILVSKNFPRLFFPLLMSIPDAPYGMVIRVALFFLNPLYDSFSQDIIIIQLTFIFMQIVIISKIIYGLH